MPDLLGVLLILLFFIFENKIATEEMGGPACCSTCDGHSSDGSSLTSSLEMMSFSPRSGMAALNID